MEVKHGIASGKTGPAFDVPSDGGRWFAEQQRAIARGCKTTALAWLERVGSWPSSDPDVAALTRAARRVMGWGA